MLKVDMHLPDIGRIFFLEQWKIRQRNFGSSMHGSYFKIQDCGLPTTSLSLSGLQVRTTVLD
jgi:hypothetical protein